ncbi:MAG: DUF3540 domain-containing protein [Polyangiaceae bacterium]
MVEATVIDIAPPSTRVEKRAGVDASRIELSIGSRSVEARRAASCLLAPAPGDRVVAIITGDEVFVTSVLTRTEAKATIELGSGVALEVDENEGLSVRGARDLRLAASRSLTAASEVVSVQANRASVLAKKLEAFGASIESSFDHMRQLGRLVEVVADEVSSRLKRSVRVVSELDQTRTNVMDVRAEGVITIHGENTCVTARQIAKIDSNQIHIG